MLTTRSSVAAAMLTILSGGPTLAATCNLTVQGAHVVEAADCTVVQAGRSARVEVPAYGTIVVRGMSMSVRTATLGTVRGRGRVRSTRLGSVVMSPDVEDKTCCSGQVATLCVER